MCVCFCFVIATNQNHSQDLLQVVERLGSLEEQEQRSGAGRAGRAELEEETPVLTNRGDWLHDQPIDSKALRAEVSADCVGAVFFQILPRRYLLTSPLRLRAGGAFAPSAGGSHRSSGCQPGVEEPLHPGPAEGAAHFGQVAESAAEPGAGPALRHGQEAGGPPAT